MSERAEIYRACREHGGIADLSARILIRLTGADRVRYLNGQVTANVQHLAPGHAEPACVTTAKGKLCADVFLHATAEALFVDAEAVLRETLPARLERYIIADDVTLEDVTDDLRLLHVFGPIAPASDLSDAAVATDRARRFGRERWDLIVPAAAFEQLWTQLAAQLVVLDPAMQETLRVEAGVPRWGCELDEDTLPPEAGLDHTHIDYHKGCYIGQEVISRLKSVGHVNRGLTGLVSTTGAPLLPGALLFAPGFADKAIGRVTSAADSFALEKPIGLGYLKRGAAFPELIARPADATSPEIVVATHDLPFVS